MRPSRSATRRSTGARGSLYNGRPTPCAVALTTSAAATARHAAKRTLMTKLLPPSRTLHLYLERQAPFGTEKRSSLERQPRAVAGRARPAEHGEEQERGYHPQGDPEDRSLHH